MTSRTAEPGNRVAAVVVGSQGTVRAGYVSPVRYDQYSAARTIEEALGVAPFTANDEYATPFNDAFTGGPVSRGRPRSCNAGLPRAPSALAPSPPARPEPLQSAHATRDNPDS